MRYGQTNGIPQGSVLMDFIAQMVLEYIDKLLEEKISKKVKEYTILRYRDDYRIFVNNYKDGELILKNLTEILIDFSFKLNSSKTNFAIIMEVDGEEKLYFMLESKGSISKEDR